MRRRHDAGVMRLHRDRGEDGVIMVIALVILTVFGLLIGLVLSEAQINFKSTEQTGTVRNMTYAADGGIEYGISRAEAGYCPAPAASPASAGSLSLSEPGNPSDAVLCQTTSGNYLANTFGGSVSGQTGQATGGYSVVTNSSGAGCVGLATDPLGVSNQIHYAAATHCATYGAGGATPTLWSVQSQSGTVTNQQLNATAYLPGDDSDGWAVGNATTLLNFDGANWNVDSCTGCPNNLNLQAVFAIDGNNIWAGGNNGSLLFDNGSDTWQQVSGLPGTMTVNSIWAADANDLWVAGAGPAAAVYYIKQTSPGVFTATAETIPTPNKALLGITGCGTNLWAVGQGGFIFESCNSGATWAPESSPTPQDLQAVTVSVASASPLSLELWAVGKAGTIVASADGVNWSVQTSGTPKNLWGVWSVPTGGGAYDVWAVGDTGTIDFSSADGSWATQIPPATNVNLQAVGGSWVGTSGSGAFEVHAVGQTGALWDYDGSPDPTGTPTNNGPPWSSQISGTTQNLRAIGGVPTGQNSSVVFAVGAPQGKNATILVSTDQSTWTSANVSAITQPQQLFGVDAMDATHAWAVGAKGQIVSTSNQTTWSTLSSPTQPQLNASFVLAASHMGAVGNNQGSSYTVLSSTNGTTWTSVSTGLGGAQTLNGVWALSATNVWAVGNHGVIIHYDGTRWSLVPSGTTQNLTAISGLSASQIWAVGQHKGPNETILAYNGTAWAGAGVTNRQAQDLFGVSAVSNSGVTSVYAVGQNGIVYFYTGTSWALQLAGNVAHTNFRGTETTGTGIGQAWAVGDHGAIWNYNPFVPDGMSIASGGPVYNAGNPQFSSVFWASDSGYVQGGTNSCSPAPSVTDLYYHTNYSCTTTAPTVSIALPAMPLSAWGACVPVANHTYSAGCKQNPNPPATTPVPGCKLQTFTPGIYNAALKPPPAGNTYFFPSGIYYFDNVGNLPFNGPANTFVIGGTPAAAESSSVSVAAASPCWSYIQSHDSGNANGVEFILGGNTAMQVQGGNIELFSRTGASSSAEGTQAVSIREACSAPGSDLTPALPCAGGWDPSNVGGNAQIFSMKAGPQPVNMDIHGSIYTPDQNVELYSANLSAGVAVGAVDCWSLELAGQSYTSPAVEIEAAGPLADRTVVITSTASSGSGSIPVSEEAYVELSSPPESDLEDTFTWRVCTSVAPGGKGCKS